MTLPEFRIPDALPVLSAGHHEPGSGKACAMDAASWISGKPEQGDAPECIHPVLRSAFIRTNDVLPDESRHELWPLILRAMGSAYRAPTDEAGLKRLNVGLELWCARYVSHLVREGDRKVCTEAIEAAERWVADPSDKNKKAAAATASAAADARLASLAGLLDEYDRLTGTTPDPIDVPWDDMLTTLGAVKVTA